MGLLGMQFHLFSNECKILSAFCSSSLSLVQFHPDVWKMLSCQGFAVCQNRMSDSAQLLRRLLSTYSDSSLQNTEIFEKKDLSFSELCEP